MIDLAKGELWTRPGGSAPLTVRVAAGSVWLTREGQAADVVLDAGTSYRSEGDGLLVVEALGPSRLSVSPPQPSPAARVASGGPARVWWIAAALLAVYVIWGSTYLAMRVALEGFPPFLMGGVRFSIAGVLLYVALRVRGTPAPGRDEWWAAARTGVLLLAGGNGLVAVAEQWVSSGIAALVVATMPLWAALMARIGGERFTRGEWAGLVVGFGGACLLQSGGELTASNAGALVVLLAPVCWALGSIWSRRLRLPVGAMGTAAQMITGGAAMLGIALLRGERFAAAPSGRAIVAVAYLTVFGSIVAFTAYGYLLRVTRPAIATSYAYVNPLIAIALGALLAGERVASSTWAAAGVIVAGVALLSLSRLWRPAVSGAPSDRRSPGTTASR